jgi:hypothetical protein
MTNFAIPALLLLAVALGIVREIRRNPIVPKTDDDTPAPPCPKFADRATATLLDVMGAKRGY